MATTTERCLPPADIEIEAEAHGTAGAGASSPTGTESPGASQLSPPPSYHDIPGTVPAHRGISRGPPPSYEDAVDPNGEIVMPEVSAVYIWVICPNMFLFCIAVI